MQEFVPVILKLAVCILPRGFTALSLSRVRGRLFVHVRVRAAEANLWLVTAAGSVGGGVCDRASLSVEVHLHE